MTITYAGRGWRPATPPIRTYEVEQQRGVQYQLSNSNDKTLLPQEKMTSVSTAEEKKRKEEYQYTDIRIRINKSFPNRFQVYIPTSLLESFKKGLEAFKIHGESASKNIVSFVIRYGEVHGKGNPQLLMETFAKPDAPSPVRVLCYLHLAGVTNEGKIYCRKHGGAWIQGIRCYSCPENQLRKEKKDTVPR